MNADIFIQKEKKKKRNWPLMDADERRYIYTERKKKKTNWPLMNADGFLF